uniref:Uncharacterized protein LOC113791378 n=1 Tax=Dermatophagoides pteronyssinus TaxID=6956 RepID=A0A6P6XVG7_DERPT|nr:uncharacterized protein LOC113791378 [Dermatophagoides pteronyssinus]
MMIIMMINNNNVQTLTTTTKINNQDIDMRNLTEWYLKIFPYKSVYGLPLSLNCSELIYDRFYRCENSSRFQWHITNDDYFYMTKKFCCFVWNTMICEQNVAAECSNEYSKKLETNKKESFEIVCDYIGSTYQSWSCWWTKDKQIYFSIGFFILIILSIFIIIGIYRINRLINSNQITGKKMKNNIHNDKLEKFLQPFSTKSSLQTITMPISITKSSSSLSSDGYLDELSEQMTTKPKIIDYIYHPHEMSGIIFI